MASGEQYALPLLISSITTVAAFLPLFLLSGASGEYAFSLAAVVALTLGRLLDHRAVHSARTDCLAPRQTERVAGNEDTAPSRGPALYASVFVSAIRFSPIVLAACMVLVVLAVTLFDRLPKQMFPLSERNQFLVYMNMPDGTDISETERRALEYRQWLADQAANPEIASQILYVGDGGPQVLSDPDAGPTGSGLRLFPGQHEGLRGRDPRRRPRMEVSLCKSSGSAVQDQAAGDGRGGIGHRRCRDLGSRRRPPACARQTGALPVPRRAPAFGTTTTTGATRSSRSSSTSTRTGPASWA